MGPGPDPAHGIDEHGAGQAKSLVALAHRASAVPEHGGKGGLTLHKTGSGDMTPSAISQGCAVSSPRMAPEESTRMKATTSRQEAQSMS